MRIIIDCTKSSGLKELQKLGASLDSECREIVCVNLLSSFKISEHKSIIDMLHKKIRIGGTLVIEDFDLRTISRRFYRDEVTINFVNSAIFGESANLKSIVDMDYIEENINNKNFVVSEKSYIGDEGRFIIKIKREQ